MLKNILQNLAALVLVITISGGIASEFDNTIINNEISGITTYGRGDLDSPEEEH